MFFRQPSCHRINGGPHNHPAGTECWTQMVRLDSPKSECLAGPQPIHKHTDILLQVSDQHIVRIIKPSAIYIYIYIAPDWK